MNRTTSLGDMAIVMAIMLAPIKCINAARVVNMDNCKETWSGQLHSDYSSSDPDTHGIEVELDSRTTVQIKTCGSEQDTFVQIRDETDLTPIGFYDTDNCGENNEDLSVELEAGRYRVEVGGHYSLGTYSYSMEVSIDCNGSGDDSGDRVFIGDGLEALIHPDAATLPLVTEEPCYCSYTWDGHLWSHQGWNSEYTAYGEIGLTLTESTVTNISTCGSDGDVFVYIYDVKDGITRDYGMWDSHSCGGGDIFDYGAGVTQDISILLLPGHYTIGVAGNDFQGERALLEVTLDGCGEAAVTESSTPQHPQYVVILSITTLAVVCFGCSIIFGFAYFHASNDLRVIRVDSTPRLQDQGSSTPKFQVTMTEQCIY